MPSMGVSVLRDAITSYSYVVLWMSISISVIMFNKWLLAFSGFPFPIALTLWHMIFCSSVGFLCVRVFKLTKSHNMSASDYLRRVMPIGEEQRSLTTVPPRLLLTDGRVLALGGGAFSGCSMTS